jgi:hypothetical protein
VAQAHRRVVDLGGLDFLNDANEICGIGHVAIMQRKSHIALVRVLVEMINALGIE